MALIPFFLVPDRCSPPPIPAFSPTIKISFFSAPFCLSNEKNPNPKSLLLKKSFCCCVRPSLAISFAENFLGRMVALTCTADSGRMVASVSRTGREMQRYTGDGRRLVVGCIPYRLVEDKLSEDSIDEAMEVLVITSQKGHGTLFPKGGWENDEEMEEAASREAWEEAGVCGDVQDILGRWSFMSKRYGTYYEGYVFPLRVTELLDRWPEENVRGRRWVTVAEARECCQQWWMIEALERLNRQTSATNRNLFYTSKTNGQQAEVKDPSCKVGHEPAMVVIVEATRKKSTDCNQCVADGIPLDLLASLSTNVLLVPFLCTLFLLLSQAIG
ncbi:hypothetical protein ACLOJK_007092 [Asimina triloba]